MASRTPPLDPRIGNPPPAPEEASESGVRPVVALPRSGPSAAVFVAAIIVSAIILFVILDSRRRTQAEPPAQSSPATSGTSLAPPPSLYIPPPPPAAVLVPAPVQTILPQPQAQPPAPVYVPQPPPEIRYIPQPVQPMAEAPPPPQRTSNSPTVVIDTSTPPSAAPAAEGATVADRLGTGGALGSGQPVGRVRSSVFVNRSTTVVQGALIQAVLETAFDSRRPGFARAIVSRDVRGFDGRKVLIPRGSRLTGEYRSDINAGQKRALINWTRLIRPDGVTMAIASPAADTLGRGGVRGKYNGHFFSQFAGAILQSALQIGTNVASRAASGSVVVAFPGSTQNMAPLLESDRIVPSLTVPAGTSISVFVARDLDFSVAEKPR